MIDANVKAGDTVTVKGIAYVVAGRTEHGPMMRGQGWAFAVSLRRPKGRREYYANVAPDGFVGDLIALSF